MSLKSEINPSEKPDAPSIAEVAKWQCAFFRTGATKEIAFRKRQLVLLRNAIIQREADILLALRNDLGRPKAEALMGEIAMVLHEIDFALKHLSSWARPHRVRTPLFLFPGSSWACVEPYGSVLIIGPWNYPFQLTLLPLASALAAGNCAVVKPSELAPHTSALLAEMIGALFQPAYVAVVEGGAAETDALLGQRFDYIFFTGSVRVGKIIMAAAAHNLTPVTLELGGKNPCIVHVDADLDVAARRIAHGKFINAGQTCIAPDFVLAHASIKAALVSRMKAAIQSFYGDDPRTSSDYGRIVNDQHLRRLSALLKDGQIEIGGEVNAEELYIAPTVICDVTWSDAILQEEIFGPILPLLAYEDLDMAIEMLQARPKPLALYFFSKDRGTQNNVLDRLSAGGACINDTLGQMLNLRLPFGGIGDSGIGAYHGKPGFDAFSHQKGVVRRATWADPWFRYPPYRIPLGVVRRLMRIMF